MNKLLFVSSVAVAMGAGLLPLAANAQYGGGGITAPAPAPVATQQNSASSETPLAPVSPLYDGSYIAVMGTYQKTLENDPELSNGFGGLALLGYRARIYALETGAGYTVESGIDRFSFKFRGLFFPFGADSTLYGLVGAGMSVYQSYPYDRVPLSIAGDSRFTTGDLAAGLGYMFPIKTGNYEFAIRAEGVFELGDRFLKRESDFITDISAPSTFKQVLFNIGLQLPVKSLPPPPPPPEPVAVVAAPVDSDGDGVPDDLDQCPGTPAGVKVDEKGCPLPPPLPPCKTPEPGERMSLAGCGTGDVIVLRGVNFEFNKFKLTANAKTILDNVGEELKSHPDIQVELGGHTDAKGSDEYNQKLSEQRAASVVAYLTSLGIAADRMTTAGYGEAQPMADNETDEGRELNRRVELKVTTSNASSAAALEAGGSPAPEEVTPAAVSVPEPVPATAPAVP